MKNELVVKDNVNECELQLRSNRTAFNPFSNH
jgi:hypothetical protein